MTGYAAPLHRAADQLFPSLHQFCYNLQGFGGAAMVLLPLTCPPGYLCGLLSLESRHHV